MKRLLNSRRTYVATLGIICITALGVYLKIDVSMTIATIVVSIAGSNAIEKFSNKESK